MWVEGSLKVPLRVPLRDPVRNLEGFKGLGLRGLGFSDEFRGVNQVSMVWATSSTAEPGLGSG